MFDKVPRGTKEQAISGFLSYASERIHERGGVVTADVLGTVIDSATDIGRVGQNYAELGNRVGMQHAGIRWIFHRIQCRKKITELVDF